MTRKEIVAALRELLEQQEQLKVDVGRITLDSRLDGLGFDSLSVMDFFYDVVDWVGGYPYEYASVGELESICRRLGLTLLDVRPAGVPTGCNELVFVKRG